jgi:hypothetical protein
MLISQRSFLREIESDRSHSRLLNESHANDSAADTYSTERARQFGPTCMSVAVDALQVDTCRASLVRVQTRPSLLVQALLADAWKSGEWLPEATILFSSDRKARKRHAQPVTNRNHRNQCQQFCRIVEGRMNVSFSPFFQNSKKFKPPPYAKRALGRLCSASFSCTDTRGVFSGERRFCFRV